MAVVELGEVFQTAGVATAVSGNPAAGVELTQLLTRYQNGDWGDVSPDDAELNNQALEDGSRILAAYDTEMLGKIWIITDAAYDDGHRHVTTILFPSEY